MLAKDQRLNLSREFKTVRADQRAETPNLKIFYTFASGNPQVGVSLVKKAFPKATLRNQVKRIVFQAVKNQYHNLRPGLKLVIMPKVGCLEKTPDAIEEELKSVKNLY